MKQFSLLFFFLLFLCLGWFLHQTFQSLPNLTTNAILSPTNTVNQETIKVYPDKVLLNLTNATLIQIEDTHSMEPTLNKNSNALIQPKKDFEVGDIVLYQTQNTRIIHRIIAKNQDQEGTYFILKGDNSKEIDPEKIRENQIQGVVVAIIY